jgi:DMSO reductase anchor subunit
VVAGAAGFFFWQRVGIGLLAPGILIALFDRTVRIGSTQSATGLLYVTVIFILMGEMISRYLFLTLGIPG